MDDEQELESGVLSTRSDDLLFYNVFVMYVLMITGCNKKQVVISYKSKYIWFEQPGMARCLKMYLFFSFKLRPHY